MNATGTYVVEDLVAAARLHSRRRLLVTAALIAVLSISFFSRAGFEEFGAGIPGWALWVPAIALLYLALLSFFAIPYRCKRELGERKDFQRPLTLTPSDAGLDISSEVLSGTRPWSDFHKWTEGQKIFLLYLSFNVSLVVPERFFASSADVGAFRELLERKVPRRGG